MKYLNLVLIILVFSCSQDPKEAFMKRVDEFVRVEFLPSLKDPSSFEKAEVTLDTFLYKDYFTIIMGMDEDLLAGYTDRRAIFANLLSMSPDDASYIEENQENEKNILKIQASLDTLKSLPSGPDAEKIWNINISYSYRAKNSMGALDKSVVEISYYPEKDSFEIR